MKFVFSDHHIPVLLAFLFLVPLLPASFALASTHRYEEGLVASIPTSTPPPNCLGGQGDNDDCHCG